MSSKLGGVRFTRAGGPEAAYRHLCFFLFLCKITQDTVQPCGVDKTPPTTVCTGYHDASHFIGSAGRLRTQKQGLGTVVFLGSAAGLNHPKPVRGLKNKCQKLCQPGRVSASRSATSTTRVLTIIYYGLVCVDFDIY